MEILLVVDVQNDFCPGGALAVPNGDAIIPTINKLINSGVYDLVIFTKDWHPSNHISFADNHLGAKEYDILKTANGSQTLWPRHCVQKSFGAELHALLDVQSNAKIITKGTDPTLDSYSGFFDNSHKQETGLQALLSTEAHNRGEKPSATRITVCGLALDYCVAASARDARLLGYNTELIIDACAAVELTPGDALRSLRELRDLGVDLKECREVLPLLIERNQNILPNV